MGDMPVRIFWLEIMCLVATVGLSGCAVSATATRTDRGSIDRNIPPARSSSIYEPLETSAFVDLSLVKLIPKANAINLLARKAAAISPEMRCSIDDQGVRREMLGTITARSAYSDSAAGAIYVERGFPSNYTVFRSVIVVPGLADCAGITEYKLARDGCFIYAERKSASPSRTFNVVVTSLASLNVKICTIGAQYPRVP